MYLAFTQRCLRAAGANFPLRVFKQKLQASHPSKQTLLTSASSVISSGRWVLCFSSQVSWCREITVTTVKCECFKGCEEALTASLTVSLLRLNKLNLWQRQTMVYIIPLLTLDMELLKACSASNFFWFSILFGDHWQAPSGCSWLIRRCHMLPLPVECTSHQQSLFFQEELIEMCNNPRELHVRHTTLLRFSIVRIYSLQILCISALNFIAVHPVLIETGLQHNWLCFNGSQLKAWLVSSCFVFQSKDIGIQMHEELVKVTNELYTVSNALCLFQIDPSRLISSLNSSTSASFLSVFLTNGYMLLLLFLPFPSAF